MTCSFGFDPCLCKLFPYLVIRYQKFIFCPSWLVHAQVLMYISNFTEQQCVILQKPADEQQAAIYICLLSCLKAQESFVKSLFICTDYNYVLLVGIAYFMSGNIQMMEHIKLNTLES